MDKTQDLNDLIQKYTEKLIDLIDQLNSDDHSELIVKLSFAINALSNAISKYSETVELNNKLSEIYEALNNRNIEIKGLVFEDVLHKKQNRKASKRSH